MTEGKPIYLIVTFALPLMLGNMFQQLYSVVDSMIVGKTLGVASLAALGAASWPNWIIIGMVQGLSQGISILLARSFGKEDYRELRKGFGNSIVLSAVFAVTLMVLANLLVIPVLHLLDTPHELMSSSLSYLRVAFSGIIIITAYNLLAATLRALGDSRTPLYAMIGASLVNVVLDLLHLFRLPYEQPFRSRDHFDKIEQFLVRIEDSHVCVVGLRKYHGVIEPYVEPALAHLFCEQFRLRIPRRSVINGDIHVAVQLQHCIDVLLLDFRHPAPFQKVAINRKILPRAVSRNLLRQYIYDPVWSFK